MSVRGFILAPTSATDNQHIVKLAREGAPIVLIDRVAENVRCDSVVVDNEGGAREAVDYLVANGHRRIALLRDESRIFTAQERFAGYQQFAAIPWHRRSTNRWSASRARPSSMPSRPPSACSAAATGRPRCSPWTA